MDRSWGSACPTIQQIMQLDDDSMIPSTGVQQCIKCGHIEEDHNLVDGLCNNCHREQQQDEEE